MRIAMLALIILCYGCGSQAERTSLFEQLPSPAQMFGADLARRSQEFDSEARSTNVILEKIASLSPREQEDEAVQYLEQCRVWSRAHTKSVALPDLEDVEGAPDGFRFDAGKMNLLAISAHKTPLGSHGGLLEFSAGKAPTLQIRKVLAQFVSGALIFEKQIRDPRDLDLMERAARKGYFVLNPLRPIRAPRSANPNKAKLADAGNLKRFGLVDGTLTTPIWDGQDYLQGRQ